MTCDDRWVSGDGGPTIVLQAGAVEHWQGANDFDNSLMQGGSVETDYDVICRDHELVQVLERHGRDLIVLSDCEWTSCVLPSTDERVLILQIFGTDRAPEELAAHLLTLPPERTLPFRQHDDSLRLMVGADSEIGGLTYPVVDVPCPPGQKVCEIYSNEEGLLLVLRHATTGA